MPPTVPPACAGSVSFYFRYKWFRLRLRLRLHQLALLYFSGKLLLFDVQSSTTEKVQKARYHLHLRRGGARRLAWE